MSNLDHLFKSTGHTGTSLPFFGVFVYNNGMINHCLLHLEHFRVVDVQAETLSYGCSQSFYKTRWKRVSGCGPTAASNLVLYNMMASVEMDPLRVESCRHIMNVMFNYVTPGLAGVNTTQRFLKGIQRYLKDHHLPYITRHLDIPKHKEKRPSLEEVIDFISHAIDENMPVAFLNLHNGETKQLDEWHWVTIVHITHTEDHTQASIQIMDDGKFFNIDLGLWLTTTQNKGGFICLPILKEDLSV